MSKAVCRALTRQDLASLHPLRTTECNLSNEPFNSCPIQMCGPPFPTAEFHVLGENCVVIDSRPQPAGPCKLSNLLFHTLSSLAWSHPGGEIRSVLYPGLGWQSLEVGWSLQAALGREGFLQEGHPSGQMESDSVHLSAGCWCLAVLRFSRRNRGHQEIGAQPELSCGR